MSLVNNGLDLSNAASMLSNSNFTSLHQNEANAQPQYDRNNANGFERLNGVDVQGTVVHQFERGKSANSTPVNGSTPNGPIWDRQRRELRVGKTVVKRFKWPAENQERVLDAFQENGWPDRLDDPLLPHPQICPKRRLHDTLKCLNRKQVNEALKFRGDGTGLGIVLEIVAEKQ